MTPTTGFVEYLPFYTLTLLQTPAAHNTDPAGILQDILPHNCRISILQNCSPGQLLHTTGNGMRIEKLYWTKLWPGAVSATTSACRHQDIAWHWDQHCQDTSARIQESLPGHFCHPWENLLKLGNFFFFKYHILQLFFFMLKQCLMAPIIRE